MRPLKLINTYYTAFNHDDELTSVVAFSFHLVLSYVSCKSCLCFFAKHVNNAIIMYM